MPYGRNILIQFNKHDVLGELSIRNVETNYASTGERFNEYGRFWFHRLKPLTDVGYQPGFSTRIPEWAKQSR